MTTREIILASATAAAVTLLAVSLFQQRGVHESLKVCEAALQVERNRADSLSAELYPVEIELNRFQIAFEILARRHPQAAEIYGNIISDETE